MSLLVGLTGGMGTGKTLAASIFKELGAHILDADLICRKLVEPGQPALKEISEYFGDNIFDMRTQPGNNVTILAEDFSYIRIEVEMI